MISITTGIERRVNSFLNSSFLTKLTAAGFIKPLIKGIIAEKKQIQDLYNKTLRKFAKADKKNRPLYRAQLMQYRAMLKECNNKMKEALQEYRQEISETKGAYVTALNSLEEKVNEMMLLSYTGTVEVRWNNLEAGLNSHAAWDRYNLDGTGIKIAFLNLFGRNTMLA